MAKKKTAPKKPAHPVRTIHERHIQISAILAAFDRFMSSANRDAGFLNIFMHRLIDSEEYRFDDWTDAAARAVLEAHALNCPSTEFDVMIKSAQDSMRWIAGWELRHSYEQIIGKPDLLDDICYESLGNAMVLSVRRVLSRTETQTVAA